MFGISANGFTFIYLALLSSLDLELDRLRLAFAASQLLDSIANWRYVFWYAFCFDVAFRV